MSLQRLLNAVRDKVVWPISSLREPTPRADSLVQADPSRTKAATTKQPTRPAVRTYSLNKTAVDAARNTHAIKTSHVRDAVGAVFALVEELRAGTFRSDHLMSRRGLIQRHVSEIYTVSVLQDILQLCEHSIEENGNITELVILVLDRVANLPDHVWDTSMQDELLWSLVRASQCRCTTERFSRRLSKIIHVSRMTASEVIIASNALLRLHIVSSSIASRLAERYLELASTGSAKSRHSKVRSLLLYCALCKVDSQPLINMIGTMQIIAGFDPIDAQYLISLDALPATTDQQKQVLEGCKKTFHSYGLKRSSDRPYGFMSWLVGKQFVVGHSLVGGVKVDAVSLFNQHSLQPINLENGDCPVDVYDRASVNMNAAKRHGYAVVACLGISERILLRHPRHEPSGYGILKVSALKAMGCYVIPVLLEKDAGAQVQVKSIPALHLNYPHHIPVFQ
eukprot:scpid69119/ scgid21697/ 